MSAQIIPFPNSHHGRLQAGEVGVMLRDALGLPARDPELSLLMTMCESLLSHYDDGLCDRFLHRLDRWEADNQRG